MWCFLAQDPLKDHVVGLASPASSGASLRALCGQSPDSTVPNLQKTHWKFPEGTALNHQLLFVYSSCAFWNLTHKFPSLKGFRENIQQELWRRKHCMGGREAGQVCTQVRPGVSWFLFYKIDPGGCCFSLISKFVFNILWIITCISLF